MNADLASRLRKTYPTGRRDDRDDSTLDSPERDERIRNAIRAIIKGCLIRLWPDPFDKPAFHIAFTQKGNPEFEQWTMGMGNPEKLEWIEANGGTYPVFWIKISRVADYYDCYFNHWIPRGDTGYLDRDFRRQPNELWARNEKAIRTALEGNGFTHITDELARERTELVLKQDYDCMPPDDPRWLDDNFEPPYIPTSVHESLFGT